MQGISFCIATAKNEKYYTKLLLQSLKDHTDLSKHEIIIFIDSDNQNTWEMLDGMRPEFPNMRIFRNTDPYPIGSQRNVSLMFHAASKDIVCYLQSDMVVGKNFDQVILDTMIGHPEIIMSVCRIEPPLHPESPDKIIMNFGTDPLTFAYEEFNKFVDMLIEKKYPDQENYFVPTIIHKKTWFDVLGGFDTQFRCSREDSDFIVRATLAGLKFVQSWRTFIYHFTCVSSRGKDWFKQTDQSQVQNTLQQLADNEELKRFIRKWGFFGHKPLPVYDIGIYIDIDQFIDFSLLEWLDVHCKTLYLNNQYVVEELARRIKFDSVYYSNLRWNYSTEHWNKVKHLFNQDGIDTHIKFVNGPQDIPNHDVMLTVKYSDMYAGFGKEKQKFLQNLNNFIYTHNIGEYNIQNMKIAINHKRDLSSHYVRFDLVNQLLDDTKFVFE